jgi:iron complex outermembrane receptor protein
VLQYRPTPELLVYGSYTRGYTAGGFNTEAATPAALRAAFAPETVDNHEAGVKSEWFGRRLRVNLNAFQMRYEDKQELYFNNLTRVLNITNAAKAEVKGAEAEVAYRAHRWLTLSGVYGRLDTRYEDFVIPGGADNTGNRLGSSPKRKASAMAELDAPLGSGRLFGSVVYSFTSGYFTGAATDPGLFVPSYELVSASLGVASAGDRLRLTTFVRNAFDESYILIPSVQVVRGVYLGEPRTWGVSLQARF